MRGAVLAALAIGAIGAIDPELATPQDLVLTNAQIVDPATRTVTRGAIWIRDGRIAGRGRGTLRHRRCGWLWMHRGAQPWLRRRGADRSLAPRRS